jgi:hypothetical protein
MALLFKYSLIVFCMAATLATPVRASQTGTSPIYADSTVNLPRTPLRRRQEIFSAIILLTQGSIESYGRRRLTLNF